MRALNSWQDVRNALSGNKVARRREAQAWWNNGCFPALFLSYLATNTAGLNGIDIESQLLAVVA